MKEIAYFKGNHGSLRVLCLYLTYSDRLKVPRVVHCVSLFTLLLIAGAGKKGECEDGGRESGAGRGSGEEECRAHHNHRCAPS